MKRRRKKSISEEQCEAWKRLYRRRLDSASRKEWLDACNQNVIAQLEGYGPLGQYAAMELRRWYSSPCYVPGWDESKHQMFEALIFKQLLQDCGMTATEAEQEVAEALDISVEAWRKRLQRELPDRTHRTAEVQRAIINWQNSCREGFAQWMRQNFPELPFEYAGEGMICHCHSEEQALTLKASVERIFLGLKVIITGCR
jgi:hypothetical protein